MKKQKQEIYHEKKKRSWKKTIAFWIAAFFILDIIVCVLFSVVGKASLGAVLHNKNFWLAILAADCLILAGYLMLYKIDAQNVALKGNDLEDSSWMTQKEMKKLREFSVSLLPELKDREDALVIGAVTRDDGKLEVTTTVHSKGGKPKVLVVQHRAERCLPDNGEKHADDDVEDEECCDPKDDRLFP